MVVQKMDTYLLKLNLFDLIIKHARPNEYFLDGIVRRTYYSKDHFPIFVESCWHGLYLCVF